MAILESAAGSMTVVMASSVAAMETGTADTLRKKHKCVAETEKLTTAATLNPEAVDTLVAETLAQAMVEERAREEAALVVSLPVEEAAAAAFLLIQKIVAAWNPGTPFESKMEGV